MVHSPLSSPFVVRSRCRLGVAQLCPVASRACQKKLPLCNLGLDLLRPNNELPLGSAEATLSSQPPSVFTQAGEIGREACPSTDGIIAQYTALAYPVESAIDLGDQTAQFYSFKVTSTAILTYFGYKFVWFDLRDQHVLSTGCAKVV